VKGWALAGLLLPALAGADRGYVGLASDPESGRPMYEEHHFLRGTPQAPAQRLVLYRCPDGSAFARKQVRYGKDATAPSFELDDARFGYREGVERVGGKVIAFARRDASSAPSRAAVEATPRLVADAGFDELVRLHWDELQRGEAVPLDFVVPSRGRSYRFTVRRIGARDIEGEPASVFRLGMSGVLGWFAPDLEVSYRDSDRRLMQFAGLTNIRENREDSYSARIDFPLAREFVPGAGAWERAAAEPLAGCRIGR
jgi:hypothetical protein